MNGGGQLSVPCREKWMGKNSLGAVEKTAAAFVPRLATDVTKVKLRGVGGPDREETDSVLMPTVTVGANSA